MNNIINKLKLINYKRFDQLIVEFDPEMNLIIGNNESGKSSILEAIDLVLSGSRSKIEAKGLENLFHAKTVETFLASAKKMEDLPKLIVELYLNDTKNEALDGSTNTEKVSQHGLRLVCEPNDELSVEIKEILSKKEPNFPFEFYSIIFETFAGQQYSPYRKFVKGVLIDNSQIGSEQATKDFIKTLFESKSTTTERIQLENLYRESKDVYKAKQLVAVNKGLEPLSFDIRSGYKANLINDLALAFENINIENKGKGMQCFIKTRFVLKNASTDLEVVLLEEPENHLSHLLTQDLIGLIKHNTEKQIFVATHSSLISTRLDLRKSIFLNKASTKPALLKHLSQDTADFFIKAPDNNLLEFVLSNKVLLVEGDAEFMLMETFFNKISPTPLKESGVHIISVGGTGFKRYLEISKLLEIKCAVIRDNDGNHKENCENNYTAYAAKFIGIFYHTDDSKNTFEKILYEENKTVCDALFSSGRRTLTVQNYMLGNKTEAAFELLTKKSADLEVPEYIKKAIEWINA